MGLFSSKKPGAPISAGGSVRCDVAGTEHRPKEIERVHVGTVQVMLQRDPRNRHDPNAVEVRYEGRLVGFVPRRDAEKYAPWLDAIGGRVVVDGERGTRLEVLLPELTSTMRCLRIYAELTSEGRAALSRKAEGLPVSVRTAETARGKYARAPYLELLTRDGAVVATVPARTRQPESEGFWQAALTGTRPVFLDVYSVLEDASGKPLADAPLHANAWMPAEAR